MRFVPLASVDPVFFDRTYFLAPASNAAQRRPYVLLLEAMKGTEMAALGRFILRGQEHFSLIRARGNALVLETLFVAEDVHSQAEIEEAVGDTKVKDAELDLARQVIESLEGDFAAGRAARASTAATCARCSRRSSPARRSRGRSPSPRTLPSSTCWRPSGRASPRPSKQGSSRKAPAKKKTAARPKAKAAARKSA